MLLLPVLLLVAVLAVAVVATSTCTCDRPFIDEHGYRIAGGRS